MNSEKQLFKWLLAIVGILAFICFGTRLHAATNIVTYNYDSLNRLTNATYSDGSRESYSYDPAGNRLTRITRGPTVHSDTEAPSVPSNLTAQVFSPTQYRLGWSRSFDTGGSGFAGYSIFINNVLYTNTTATNQLVSGLLPGSNYTFVVTAYDRAANTSSPSSSLSVTVSSPPAVTVNPTNQTAFVGDSVSISVTATGNPVPSYQWWKDGVPLASQTNSLLVLNPITTNSAGGYFVVITNVAGSATSSVASLTVNRLLPTLMWPTPPAIIYGTVLTTGQLNAVSGSVPGTNAYTPPLGTLLNAGTQLLSVMFTPTDPATYANASTNVSLIVNPAPLTVSANNQSRLYGQTNAPFTLTYSGFVNGEGTNVLSVLPSASTTATTNSPPGNYPIQVSGGIATNYAITLANGILTVTSAPPVIISQPIDGAVIAGSNMTFTVTATGTPPLIYQWRKGGMEIPGANSSALSISNVQPAHAGVYSVRVSNVAGSVFSSNAVLTVSGPATLGPDFLWVRQAGASNQSSGAWSTAIDRSGDIVVLGQMGPNINIGGTNVSAGGSNGMFVAKYTPAGILQWVRTIGGDSMEPQQATTDNSGNIFVLGFSWKGNLTFGGQLSTPTISNAWFLAKYAPNGVFLWAKEILGDSIATDGAGNVAFSGSFSGTVQSGTNSVTSTGGQDILLGKYDGSGNLLWIRSAGGASLDGANAVASDGSGNVFVTGQCSGTANFGSQLLTGLNAFVAKYDAAGNCLWVRGGGGGPSQTFGTTVRLDSVGNVFAIGNYLSSARFGATVLPPAVGLNSFLLKYDSSGTLLWARAVVPELNGFNQGQDTTDLAVDTYGNAYIAGSAFGGSVTFGLLTIKPALPDDVFLVKFDSDGNAVWARTVGVKTLVMGYGLNRPTVGLGTNGETYLAGHFIGTANFGNTTLTSVGPLDAFVARLGDIGSGLPVVTTQPVSQTVNAGQSASFVVTVTGAEPFSYQWQKDGLGLPGQTAATLTLANVGLTDAGAYNVQVSNSAGLTNSVTATLTVQTPPSFITQPQPTAVSPGNTAFFTVAVDGVPVPVLNWFKDGVRLTNAAGLTGATATTLVIDVTGTNQIGSYFATASNAVGSSTSSVVTLTVLLTPGITTQPTNVLLLRTSLANVLPATFSVVATGTAPLLYQWRFNGNDLSGATNPAFNLTNVTRLDNGLYSVVVSNTVGTATSSNALLRVRVPQRLALPERLSDGRLRLGFIDDLGGLPTTNDVPFIEVQFATNLTASNIFWLPLTNAVTVTNGMLVVDEAPGTVGPHRFYRVIER